MKTVLRALDRHVAAIEGSVEELNSPALAEGLAAVEQEQGDSFLFDSYRIYPLPEVMEVNLASRKSMLRAERHTSDDSGTIKDCLANEKWIAFGDNGGSVLC